MYALEPEPEAGRRWTRLVAGAMFGVLLLAGAFAGGKSIKPRLPEPLPERMQLRVVQQAVPRAQVQAEQPIAEASPKIERSIPQRPVSKPANPTPAPAEPVTAPPPLLVGLTLSSTTHARGGTRFAVGNALMGKPARKAAAPRRIEHAPRTSPAKPERSPQLPGKARRAAKLRHSISPKYPPQAKREGIEGVVVLSITIDAAGQVESASVLRGLGYGLDEAAVRAARETLWEPATLSGEPVRTTRRFKVRFTLRG